MRRLRIPLDINDVVALGGVALLAIGAGLIFLPAAFIVTGALLLLYAVLVTRGVTP